MRFIYYLAIGVMALSFASCDDYEALTQDIFDKGETIYLQKPDSIVGFPGKERIKFKMWYFNGNQLSKTIFYWNNKQDSAIVSLKLKSGMDSLECDLKLPESIYNFKIVNINSKGDRSLPIEYFSSVYGEDYAKRINQRILKAVSLEKNNQLKIEWYGTSNDFLCTEINYTNSSGQKLTVKGSSANVTRLDDFPKDGSFSYRTGYLPEPTAIDAFYTDWSEPVELN